MSFIASPPVLPGNILSVTDSDFEAGSPSWVSFSNATIVGSSTAQAFIGTHAFAWTATTAADSQITTGFYPCKAGQGYDFSGLAWATYNHDAYIGVNWYTSGGVLIGSTVWSSDYSITGGTWQPLSLAGTCPATATQFKLLAWVGTNVAAGETFYIDMMFAANVDVQILIDWNNPAFSVQSQAGVSFFDVTPWVRLVDNVSINRGRQNKISEIQSGAANFTLQNDYGWFTKYNANSPVSVNLGGTIDLGARCQVNVCDQVGNWNTRFDGPVAEIDQAIEATGTSAIASIVTADVLAYLNRQVGLFCWTKEAVFNSVPWLHWTLDDSNNAGSLGVAAETSGNNGPALHPVTTNTTATIGWKNSNGGVESLADASAAGKPDMCEFWQPGSDVSTGVNGLDSGVAGPYQTPLSSAYFTPVVTTGSAQDTFTTSSGYILTGQLNQQTTGVMTPTNGNNYAAEVWFAMDPYIGAHSSANSGPFIAMSLGNSRSGSCVVFGVWLSTGHLTCQIMSFAQPPAFAMNNFGVVPTALQNVGAQLASDKVPLPHHMVANITGANGGAALEFFCDGVDIGGITLPVGVIYDTITIGGAYGGWGCFYGNIQLASLYQRILTGTEIQQHCNLGQYGMWESTTDDCIELLGNFSSIPQFWNGLIAQDCGLTLTDYYDITNATPLAAMQIYEQAEQGLIYVPANGALTFATRDWRQGHGAPDLMLPPDVYTASLGYQLVDQFIINQAAVSTNTYQKGVSWQNAASNGQYGNYASGTTQSPTQLPLITWNRANAALGLPQYTNSPDPVLNDDVAWLVNTQCNSRLTYSSLTLDLLTLDPLSGLTISQLYGLEINNMVGLSGTLPAVIANQAGANELFVEGINEVIGLSQHTMTIYTSPASTQRAWIPGDATYGVLGSTSRVGLSAPDVSTTPAIGKDVAHDSGGPYWPPSFIVEPTGVYQFGYVTFNGTSGSLTGNYGLRRVYQGDAIIVEVMCPASSTIAVGPDSQGNVYTQVASKQLPSSGAWQYVFYTLGATPLNSSDSIAITGSVSQNYVTAAFGLANVLALDATPATASGTGTTTSISTGAMSTGYDLEIVIDFNNSSASDTIPVGWNYAQNNFGLGSLYDTIFWKQSQGSTTSDAFSVTHSSVGWAAIALTFTIQGVTLNNPLNNGNQFIGSLEMRGLHDSLALALQPPMTVVAALGHQQTFASGTLAAPQIVWDQIYIDSAGGMSAIPGWPSWYVCTVPGFYELSGCAKVTVSTAGSASGYIAVASQAAQAVAAGTANPQTVGVYICPVGEEHQMNTVSTGLCMSPSTRLYLGIGDMVALCVTQNTGSSDTTDTRSIMSIRWCGYSTTNDQVMLNTSLGGPGTTTQIPPTPVNPGPGGGGNGGSSGSSTKKVYQAAFATASNYSYYGTSSSYYPQLRSTNGNAYQGEYPGRQAAGSEFTVIVLPYTTIHSALSGATINWIRLTAHNLQTWYSAGGTLVLGWTSTVPTGGNSYSPGASDHLNCQQVGFSEGQTRIMSLGSWAKNLCTTGTALILGDNNTTNPHYYGYWANAFTLTVNYTK
jgi:hypothetical protein